MPPASALMLMPTYGKNNNNCSATRVDRSVGRGMYLLLKSVRELPQLLFLVNKVCAKGLWTYALLSYYWTDAEMMGNTVKSWKEHFVVRTK